MNYKHMKTGRALLGATAVNLAVVALEVGRCVPVSTPPFAEATGPELVGRGSHGR